MTTLLQVEVKRQSIQAAIDSSKSMSERNKNGQFSTPISLAKEILHEAVLYLPQNEKISFFDPAIGTGSFFSAILRALQ